MGIDFETYKYLLGETIGYYQLLENDLKLIFAGMMKGENFAENYDITCREFQGLGKIITALKELDNSDNKPYFSQETYRLLFKLAGERNYFCHKCCLDFRYIQDFEKSKEYAKACKKLIDSNKLIKDIHAKTEEHRLKILKDYHRI